MTGNQLIPGVGNPDEWTFQIVIGVSHGFE
jgi:hypothetical protein